jgi:hypothetical protein
VQSTNLANSKITQIECTQIYSVIAMEKQKGEFGANKGKGWAILYLMFCH